jgi:hypothetical protein
MRILTLGAQLALAAVTAATTGGVAAAKTATETVYSFCGHDGGSCLNGYFPVGGLTIDAQGNLYGTASQGGTHNNSGVAFELSPDGDKWKFHKIYDFCSQANCEDGQTPYSSMIADVNGNLYGVAIQGGSGNCGVAYELKPDRKRKHWKFHTIYDFCSKDPDGYWPYGRALTYAGAASGAPYDGVSPLYGVTRFGGADIAHDGNFGYGIAFSLTPGKSWTEDVLHIFCSDGTDTCPDGATPAGGLLADANGNLFGMTSGGGVNGGGTAFEISLATKRGSESYTVLHSFCSQVHCTDGRMPDGEFVMDGTGKLLGVTGRGGHRGDDLSVDNGTVFSLTPNGTNSAEQVLYEFCAKKSCPDGAAPTGGVALSSTGAVFGLTQAGGSNLEGLVYELNPGEKILYHFCMKLGCRDGNIPTGPVLLDPSGNLIFITNQGGKYDKGAIFKLTP